MSEVSLREVTRETVVAVCELEVAPEQTEFVASNARSIAEAYFQPKSWFRAVYAGEAVVTAWPPCASGSARGSRWCSRTSRPEPYFTSPIT